MGFKLGNNIPPMERELSYLLHDLCVKWGFCLPPDYQDLISKKESYNSLQFAQDIIKAEGMEGYTEWVNKIAERFRERFGTDEIDSSTFVDRVRGTKEIW
ncbi:MAG: hypothetical protein MRY83_09370 [Flavobacteriales bacterium]|nr:hypothetical protein [Flavobacteriales bacterium]